jgi:hypothetical protein
MACISNLHSSAAAASCVRSHSVPSAMALPTAAQRVAARAAPGSPQHSEMQRRTVKKPVQATVIMKTA